MKPQLVIRQQGQLYLAEFNMATLENRSKHIYRTEPDFRKYITIGGKAPELRQEGSAVLTQRQYLITERLQGAEQFQALNVAHIQHDIYLAAQAIAEQEGFEYFGLIVSAAHPSKPVDADKDPYDISDIIKPECYDSFTKETQIKNFFMPKPVRTDWILNPTVQLYLRQNSTKGE